MQPKSVWNAAVVVAALGYFVDVYDLLLFSIVRKESLQSLGLSGEELTHTGILLLDMQMIGMLMGGILWGVLGDKKGRLSVLFGSIATYSIANLANGAVDTVFWYAFWRFIAGLGLAGELGVGITLVTEVMPKETRGYATTLVASIGIAGAVFAGWIGQVFDWRTCYYIGGGLGLSLLLLRVGVQESGMFKSAQQAHSVKKGDFLALFRNSKIFLKYLRFILIGLPVWYVVGILITFSPELATQLGLNKEPDAGIAVMYCYSGLVVGDLVSGSLSQMLKSRKLVLYIFWGISLLAVALFFLVPLSSENLFFAQCTFLGFSVGSWVVFMTSASEQFGTNLRATVTTSVPNFVRGAVVPLTATFQGLAPYMGLVGSAVVTGVICLLLALWAISTLRETFGTDMDFHEAF